MNRRTTRIGAALGAAVVALSMTACAGRPSVAATVGTEQISVADVEEATDALTARGGPVPGVSSLVLNIKMRAIAAEQIASAQGLDLRAAAEESLSEQGVPAAEEPPVLRELAVNATEVEVLETRIGTEALEEGFAEVAVTVNPRYGLTGLEAMNFDSNRLPVVVNRSLSKPASTAQG